MLKQASPLLYGATQKAHKRAVATGRIADDVPLPEHAEVVVRIRDDKSPSEIDTPDRDA